MGQVASAPDANVKLQVIGAGLSRTGTTSFARALEILLDGPVYHGGTQLIKTDERNIKSWIDICQHTPFRQAGDREFVLDKVGKLIRGYVACTDTPTTAFTEEIMALYPDAKIICTVRDPDKWWASIAPIVENANLSTLSFILSTVPVMRYFRQFHDVLDDGRFGELYFRKGEPKRPSRATYDRHIEYLKRVVPPEKLFFFDVRDGWEPLCKILQVSVPDGVEFPRLNDAEIMASFMKASVKQGMMNWAVYIGAAVAATAAIGLMVDSAVRWR